MTVNDDPQKIEKNSIEWIIYSSYSGRPHHFKQTNRKGGHRPDTVEMIIWRQQLTVFTVFNFIFHFFWLVFYEMAHYENIIYTWRPLLLHNSPFLFLAFHFFLFCVCVDFFLILPFKQIMQQSLQNLCPLWRHFRSVYRRTYPNRYNPCSAVASRYRLNWCVYRRRILNHRNHVYLHPE